MFSRIGVYMRLPGVDVDRFAESMQSGGLMGYFDALTGGSISKVGVFSLGELPYALPKWQTTPRGPGDHGALQHAPDCSSCGRGMR